MFFLRIQPSGNQIDKDDEKALYNLLGNKDERKKLSTAPYFSGSPI